MTELERFEILNHCAEQKKAAKQLLDFALLQLSDDLTPKMASLSARSNEFKLRFVEWKQKESLLISDYYKKIVAIEREKNKRLYDDNFESLEIKF